jgi:3-hydroxybutyryl-CoA dehydrogenase
MKIGIVGYGKMGRGIFSLFSDAGLPVKVFVRDPAKAAQAAARLEKRLARALRDGALTEADIERQGLAFCSDLEGLRDSDLVIETIAEDFELKADLLRRLEPLLAPEALIATNTSSLSVTDLAGLLQRPERSCGLHFFHPVQLTTIVEIIRARQTSDATLGTAEEIARAVGKRPIVVRDLPGSCVNIPLSFQICESLCILEQGLALPSHLDALVEEVVRVGPCTSADVVGLPLVTAATERSLRALPTAFALPELGRRLVADGRHGKAAGRGIFRYREDRPVDDDSTYYRNPDQSHSRGGRASDEALRERMLASIYYPVLLMANLGLGSLEDLCAGIADVIGLKFDPLVEMRRLGSTGMRALFERLAAELGPRYDCGPVQGILTRLDR